MAQIYPVRFCSSCGKELDQGAAFCGHCGADVSVNSPAVGTGYPHNAIQGELDSTVQSRGTRANLGESNGASELRTPPPPPPLPRGTLFSSVNPGANSSKPRRNYRVFAIIAIIAFVMLGVVGSYMNRAAQERALQQMEQEQSSLMQRTTEITKDNIHTLCSPLANCTGKFIVWPGTVRSDAHVGDHDFQVKSLNGYATVTTSLPLQAELHEGDQVTFHGFVQQLFEPGGDDDIITKGYVRSVISAAQAEEIKRKEEEAPDSPQVLNDAKKLDEKYGIAAALSCSQGADDYLRSAAKYDFKWDDTGFLETKFDHHATTVQTPGVIVEFSDKVALSNGFGAYQHITLRCNYDSQKKKVLGYQIE